MALEECRITIGESESRVHNRHLGNLYLYGRNENCDKCPYETYGEVS
jgi:hypothetical protein